MPVRSFHLSPAKPGGRQASRPHSGRRTVRNALCFFLHERRKGHSGRCAVRNAGGLPAAHPASPERGGKILPASKIPGGCSRPIHPPGRVRILRITGIGKSSDFPKPGIRRCLPESRNPAGDGAITQARSFRQMRITSAHLPDAFQPAGCRLSCNIFPVNKRESR